MPREVAARRAIGRERQDIGRARDSFESDDGLQQRCAAVYDQLAASGWVSQWRVLDGTGAIAPGDLAEALLGG